MPAKKSSGKHVLSWKQGRRTPSVHKAGQKPPGAGGKVVKSRPATAAEERQIAKGQWIRAGKDGSKPGSAAYSKQKSSVRPQKNLQPKARKKK